MYSILIKGTGKNYTYVLNPDGTRFTGDSEATLTKLQEIMQTSALGGIEVVHNVTLTADFVLEDVQG